MTIKVWFVNSLPAPFEYYGVKNFSRVNSCFVLLQEKYEIFLPERNVTALEIEKND